MLISIDHALSPLARLAHRRHSPASRTIATRPPRAPSPLSHLAHLRHSIASRTSATRPPRAARPLARLVRGVRVVEKLIRTLIFRLAIGSLIVR